jgi:type VI protein secretion system component VasK
MDVTKADIKFVVMTAIASALSVIIASLFERSRAFMWRVAIMPIPLAIALIILAALIVTLILVARNRKHQILKLETELSEIKAKVQKQTEAQEKRNAAQQRRDMQNRPRDGGFVRNW